MDKVNQTTQARRFRDVATHQRLYPKQFVHWFGAEPHYCTGDHAPGEPHEWRPVPHYQEGKSC